MFNKCYKSKIYSGIQIHCNVYVLKENEAQEKICFGHVTLISVKGQFLPVKNVSRLQMIHSNCNWTFIALNLPFKRTIFRCMITTKNSIRDACTPQPGEIFFNTMRYRSSVTVQSSRYLQSSVSYIKVQIMLK